MAVYSKEFKVKKLIKLSKSNELFINKVMAINSDFTISYIINLALYNLQKTYFKKLVDKKNCL